MGMPRREWAGSAGGAPQGKDCQSGVLSCPSSQLTGSQSSQLIGATSVPAVHRLALPMSACMHQPLCEPQSPRRQFPSRQGYPLHSRLEALGHKLVDSLLCRLQTVCHSTVVLLHIRLAALPPALVPGIQRLLCSSNPASMHQVSYWHCLGAWACGQQDATMAATAAGSELAVPCSCGLGGGSRAVRKVCDLLLGSCGQVLRKLGDGVRSLAHCFPVSRRWAEQLCKALLICGQRPEAGLDNRELRTEETPARLGGRACTV